MAAEPLTTVSSWDDLVLDAEVRRQIDEIVRWEAHGMALFIGELGLLRDAAALIARQKGCPAYQVDLGKLVAKTAEETKANLDPVFEKAAREHGLVLIEKVEAVLTQRGGGGGRQRLYLLQRIQEYPGIVIVATNLRSLADEAFARRFQAVIHFEVPCLDERR